MDVKVLLGTSVRNLRRYLFVRLTLNPFADIDLSEKFINSGGGTRPLSSLSRSVSEIKDGRVETCGTELTFLKPRLNPEFFAPGSLKGR